MLSFVESITKAGRQTRLLAVHMSHLIMSALHQTLRKTAPKEMSSFGLLDSAMSKAIPGDLC